jgi:hypothetical protein
MENAERARNGGGDAGYLIYHADAHYERARAAGAEIVHPPRDDSLAHRKGVQHELIVQGAAAKVGGRPR